MPRFHAEMGIFINDADVALWVHPAPARSGARSWVFSLSSDRRGASVCRVTQDGDSVRFTCGGRSRRCDHVRALESLGLIR